MWDNRRSKKNPKQPDFRCKDKDCTDENGFQTGVWAEKSQNGNGNAPRNGSNKNGNSAVKAPPLLTPAQWLAAAAKLLKASHKMAKEALGDAYTPEDGRGLAAGATRAGLVEVVGASMFQSKPAPKPEPEPEREVTEPDEIPAEAYADSGLDL